MSKLNLFIDTNIFLNFYHYTNDDIEAIDLLITNVENGNIALHLPQQVHDEWERNREIKLNLAASEFRKISFPEAIPRHMHGLASAEIYKEAVIQAKKARDHLVAEATLKARTYGLEVDVRLRQLFEAATKYQHETVIFDLGKQRAELGNPPGKPGSFGDQYNWEILLAKLPDEDLYIATKDGDYVSALGGTDENGGVFPNSFLKREWNKRKGDKNLYIFQNIKSALSYLLKLITEVSPADITHHIEAPPLAQAESNNKFSVIATVLPAEHAAPPPPVQATVAGQVIGGLEPVMDQPHIAAKNAAINELVASSSFATTHHAIARLGQYREFLTAIDAIRLFGAAFDNQQIKWIIPDDDVNRFYLQLLEDFFSSLDPTTLDNAIELLGLQPDKVEKELEAL